MPGKAAQGSHLHVEGVWRRYGRGKDAFDAVRGVSFTVQPGELFALLGTNGAGKTSTVELLEGLAAPREGTIRLFGDLDPVKDRERIRSRTGVMLQEGGFISQLTVAESVQMWADLSTRPRPVDDALELTGLAHRADVMVKNLSGGEKRRLDLATATLTTPEILFLDEPTAGMDAEGRHATWKLIGGLREAGTTILLTTHYLEEAQELADHLAIMHRGRIAASGTVEQIVADHPATLAFGLPEPWTASDLPPLVGQVSTERGTTTVTTDDLQTDAAAVLAWAGGAGLRLARFTARPASLEEAFISIAGGASADEDDDAAVDTTGQAQDAMATAGANTGRTA
ncbi:Daunorubicin/doxorubicin resistance ATP-binding protein DrrA [Streptomyces sp. YIM 130001]|uniref:ABC transporter ATP-binding protein n=1 Tax=Streptomyces sp. YIM 130001 TaxID=2259644 RepID=UPI000E64FA66|nr:ABC transporter ATP-binding protein [Streptomyces sp. YIM 130001]RII13755.1 Daunorubicin/doxorubicin resistance ATP-binding protein DrrA [Streptomyces sp. YIM 130001]